MRHAPCGIAVTLLAMVAPVHAADDAQETIPALPSETSGLPPDPVAGASLCPLPNAVWQELVTLVPPDHLITRLRESGKEGASIVVEDLGGTFRVSVLDKVRAYREDARDCAYRAKEAALFAALIIDPTALLNTALCQQPPCAPAPTPAPPARVEETAPSAAPHWPFVRLEISPTLVSGLGVQARAWHLGAALRIALGSGSFAAVLGAAALWPAQTNIGGLRLREWRLPVDLGVRGTLMGTWVDFYGEIGLAFALLSERGLDLATARSPTGMELGARASVGARLARRAGFTPFVSVQTELFPDPPSVSALPQGVAGPTPRVWIGACVGASWGI